MNIFLQTKPLLPKKITVVILALCIVASSSLYAMKDSASTSNPTSPSTSDTPLDKKLVITLIKTGCLDSAQKTALLARYQLPPSTWQTYTKDVALEAGKMVVHAAASQGIGLLLNYWFSSALSGDKYPTTDREQYLARIKAERNYLKITDKELSEATFFKEVSDLNKHEGLATKVKSIDPRRSEEEILLEIFLARAKYRLSLMNEKIEVKDAQNPNAARA